MLVKDAGVGCAALDRFDLDVDSDRNKLLLDHLRDVGPGTTCSGDQRDLGSLGNACLLEERLSLLHIGRGVDLEIVVCPEIPARSGRRRSAPRARSPLGRPTAGGRSPKRRLPRFLLVEGRLRRVESTVEDEQTGPSSTSRPCVLA